LAEEAAYELALTYTPTLATGISEALDALGDFPRANRRLVLVCSGGLGEKGLIPDAIGTDAKKRGVILECYAVGEIAAADQALRTFADAAGSRIVSIPNWDGIPAGLIRGGARK
jgi:hypothetical protein